MTVKPETSFWKSVKKSLEGGKYIVSRLESVTLRQDSRIALFITRLQGFLQLN